MMYLRGFALTCKLNEFWLQQLLFPGGRRSEKSCYNQNLISVCTLKQSRRGTSCGFTNMTSNWNMSRSDWKSSPVHEYSLNKIPYYHGTTAQFNIIIGIVFSKTQNLKWFIRLFVDKKYREPRFLPQCISSVCILWKLILIIQYLFLANHIKN